MTATFLTSILSFASTNIDDIFVLMILFAQTRNAKDVLHVILGQYAGIGFLTILSMFGAWGTQIIPPRYIGLLGFVPLLLGIRAWIKYRHGQDRKEDAANQAMQIGTLSVMLLTIANGADNIGVYIPVFSGYTPAEFAVTFAVFAVMTALWCFLGFILANHPYIKKKILQYQQVLVPVIFIALGLFILTKNI